MTTYRTPAEVLARWVQSVLNQRLPDLELVLALNERAEDLPTDLLQSFSTGSRMQLVTPRSCRSGSGPQPRSAGGQRSVGGGTRCRRQIPGRATRSPGPGLRAPDDLWLLGTEVRTTHSFDDHAVWPVPGEVGEIMTLDRELLHSKPIVHSWVMAPRARLDQIGGYSFGRRRHFDYDLCLRTRQTGGVFAVIQEPLALKRIHHDQVFESDAAVVDRAWSAFRLPLAYVRKSQVYRGSATLAWRRCDNWAMSFVPSGAGVSTVCPVPSRLSQTSLSLLPQGCPALVGALGAPWLS